MTILDLSSELLRTVLRACATHWRLQKLLTQLPFLLHGALLQERTQPAHGGIMLALAAAPPVDKYAKPPRDADNDSLDAPAVTALCAQMVQLRSLVSVDFSALNPGSQQLAAIAQALAGHSQLTCIKLGVCNVALTGTRVLAEALPQWPRLRHFEASDLSWSRPGNPHAATLLQAVTALTALTRLSLPGITPGHGAFEATLPSLQALCSLNVANESCAQCSEYKCVPGSERVPITALQALQHLTELSLSCRVWHGTAQPFGASLRTLNLTQSVADAACQGFLAPGPRPHHGGTVGQRGLRQRPGRQDQDRARLRRGPHRHPQPGPAGAGRRVAAQPAGPGQVPAGVAPPELGAAGVSHHCACT